MSFINTYQTYILYKRKNKIASDFKHVTLNDFKLPFCVKFCFCSSIFGALKPVCRSLAILFKVLNLNVVGKL